ncbi:MAG: hypothetical protein IJV22_02900 [Bacteroidales bacterium]|nr:hypothetical protein [Bacteroidales bacterium]
MSQLPMFKDWVAAWLRFPLLLVLPFIYQCSNPLYMNIAGEVISDTGLRTDDVMMCGFACILGITVTFPLLFRLKFRFTTRQILLISSSSIIALSLLAEHIHLLPLLVVICFLFGIFKVWGTFECMSSMMQIISPNMHLAPFLTVVFLAVFGGVELGGLASTWICYHYTWHHITYALIGVHLLVILSAWLLMQDFRFKAPVPLRGIDWIGMALWSLFLIGLTAVFVYGETLEWMHSPSLVACLAMSIVALGLNLRRMHRIEEPFIAPHCFGYRRLWPIMVLFFVSGILLSSQSVLQNVLTGYILHYEAISSVGLNWAILAGVVAGCYIGKWGLTGMGWNYKQLTFLSMLITTMYVAAMRFLISSTTPLIALALPCFFSGVGHALIFVVLTTYVESNTPFEHRFMMLTVLGLVRTGIASPIGAALFSHLLHAQTAYHMPLTGSHPAAVMVSLRNLYAFAVLIGLLTLIIILASRFENKRYITLPTLRKIHALIEHHTT